MRRTVLQTLLAITTMAALAIATSCFSDLSGDFQQLEATTGTDVKLVDVTTGTVNSYQIFQARRVAQKISLSSRHQIHGALVKLTKFGDWSDYSIGKMRAQLYSSTGTVPNAAQGNTTEEPLVDSFPTDEPTGLEEYIPFEFTIKPTLNAGTYWLVFSVADTDDGIENVEYVSFFVDGSGSDANVTYGDVSWAPPITGNLSIVVYATTVP